jgi:predicted DNA-binding transcriptional regulator YafY
MDFTQKKISRLLKLVIEVKTDPYQKPELLRDKLGIGKTQFYKDKKTLAAVGFEFDFNRRKNRWEIGQDVMLPVENLNLSEQLALVMALRQLSAAGDHILAYHGLEAARKLSLNLPIPHREHLFDDMVIREGFGCQPKILQRLEKAITDNWRVTLTYRRPFQNKPSLEELDPYHLFFKRRALYIEGYSWSEKDIRVYRVNRISEVSFKSKGFAVRENYDFGQRYKNAFSVFGGETTQKVQVRFDKKTRTYIEETLWHHSQRISENADDGGIFFEVEVAYPREVMWWAFFWGDGAEILEPSWLRAEAKETIRKMSAVYSKNPTSGGGAFHAPVP